MAQVKRYLLTCDSGTETLTRAPHCHGIFGYEATSEELDTQARRVGWVTAPTADLCPACARANELGVTP